MVRPRSRRWFSGPKPAAVRPRRHESASGCLAFGQAGRDPYRPELSADCARPQTRDIGHQVRHRLAQINLGNAQAGAPAESLRQVVVAVDEGRAAKQFTDPVEGVVRPDQSSGPPAVEVPGWMAATDRSIHIGLCCRSETMSSKELAYASSTQSPGAMKVSAMGHMEYKVEQVSWPEEHETRLQQLVAVSYTHLRA